MAWKNKNLERIVVFFLIVGGLLSVVIWRNSVADVDVRYTIAHVHEKKYFIRKGAHKINYFYYYKGSKYSGTADYNECKIPGRYFTKFPSNHPNLDEICQDQPVPDSVKEGPREGWGYAPYEIWIENRARITKIVSEDVVEVCFTESSAEFCSNVRQSGFDASSVGKNLRLRYLKGQFLTSAKLLE